MVLAAGVHLGPYEVLAPVGAGGMGEVYRARDPRLGRAVAIKVLPSAFSADPDRLTRFEKEARAAAALNHPNVLAVYDVGQYDGAPYIVSELLEGQTLRERLAQGAVPVRKSIEFAVEIARGLAAAHDKGIVHRDLKPENIFVTTDGRLKILDFGLAKLTQAEPALSDASNLRTMSQNTRAGTVLGTVGYMSPEQVLGLAADHRSDIFAFGAVVYEVLSGRRAFGGDSVVASMTAILKEEPPDLRAADRHIPSALARIVSRCLEKDPGARFKSTDDLAFALDAVSTHADEAQAINGGAGRKRERLAWSLMTIAALAMAALAVPATLYIARPVPRPAVTRLDVVTPATDDPSSFALSPDGQRLAFVANSDKGSRIWLRLLDQGTTEPVAETEGASFPFWSPDSRSLAFFADGLLKRLDLEGGRPQLLAQARNPLGGAWNRDGDILFAPFPAGALMRVRATGGIPVAATHLLTGERSHGFPAFLPDGRRFIFHVGQSEPESEGLYLESLDTPGSRRRLIASPSAAEYLPPGYLVLVRQGSLMAAPFDPVRATVSGPQLQIASGVAVGDGRGAFSASAAGMLAYRVGPARDRRVSQRLSWINRQGEITGNLASGNYPQLTRDGKNVAFIGNSQGNTDVYLIASAQGGVPTRFTSHTAIEISSVWSPNGDRLAFASNRGGTFDLFEKPTSLTRDEEPRFASSDNKHPVDWSRNDVLLYVVQDAGGGDDLWTLTLDGNAPSPRRLFHTPHSEDQGQFSPDGRWIAYRSNETGRREIFVRPFPGPGSQRQVSVSGGGHPRWRTDGSELYYIAADGRLTAVPIKLGASSETVDTGVPSPLFVTRLAAPTNAQFGYAVAPDGRFLVSVDGDEPSTSPITIVQNWTAVKQ